MSNEYKEYLATFGASKTSLTLNDDSTINFESNNIFRFSKSGNAYTPPSVPDINDGDVIYFDLSDREYPDLRAYNTWAYNIKNIKNINAIYYIPSSGTSLTIISNEVTSKYENNIVLYCPYNTVSFDMPTVNIDTLVFSYINAVSINISKFNISQDLYITYCENMTNIIISDNFSFPSSTFFRGCIKLNNYINNIISNGKISKVIAFNISMCGLKTLPDMSGFDKMVSLFIQYNDLGGILDLTTLPPNLTVLNADGCNFTGIKFVETTIYNGIEYGLVPGYILFRFSENKIKSFYVDLNNDKGTLGLEPELAVSVCSLQDLRLCNIGNWRLDFQKTKLNHIYIDGKYFDKCSEIKKYIENTYNTRTKYFRIYNNYLIMDEQGLNTDNIFVSPQYINDNLSYDPSSSLVYTTADAIKLPTAILDKDNFSDTKLTIIEKSIYHNIDFNGIADYKGNFDDEYIRQRISIYYFKNITLNIYNAQNVLNNKEGTLYKMFVAASKYYNVEKIYTNTPGISALFPNAQIILSNSPLTIPSIFSINLVVGGLEDSSL